MFRTYLNWSKAEIRIFLFTNWKMERKSVCRIKTLEQKTNCLKRLKPKVGGADNLYRGHFILNYIYNSEKALPGQMPASSGSLGRPSLGIIKAGSVSGNFPSLSNVYTSEKCRLGPLTLKF